MCRTPTSSSPAGPTEEGTTAPPRPEGGLTADPSPEPRGLAPRGSFLCNSFPLGTPVFGEAGRNATGTHDHRRSGSPPAPTGIPGAPATRLVGPASDCRPASGSPDPRRCQRGPAPPRPRYRLGPGPGPNPAPPPRDGLPGRSRPTVGRRLRPGPRRPLPEPDRPAGRPRPFPSPKETAGRRRASRNRTTDYEAPAT